MKTVHEQRQQLLSRRRNRTARRRWPNLCAYCNGPADSDDHIDPRVKAGKGVHNNRVRAYGPCNRGKGGLPVIVYLALKMQGVRA